MRGGDWRNKQNKHEIPKETNPSDSRREPRKETNVMTIHTIHGGPRINEVLNNL